MSSLVANTHREALKTAALAEDLKSWTSLLTAITVTSCQEMGWHAAGKGHGGKALPTSRQEYLGIDTLAFLSAPTHPVWQWPVAAIELENSTSDRGVAYSLWKVLCVHASLRVVFAYRRDWAKGRALVSHLAERVIVPLATGNPAAIDGPVLIALGSRGEGETFPHGYFKFWKLDTNVREFVKF